LDDTSRPGDCGTEYAAKSTKGMVRMKQWEGRRPLADAFALTQAKL
jgi:hypothetical protein